MASPQASAKLTSKLKVSIHDHDPGSTDAKLLSGDGGTTIAYVDGRDYHNFLYEAMASTLTGSGITKLEIVASATTAFSAVTVIKDSGTVAADAVGDYVVLECTAEEIAQEGADAGVELRYVTARLTCQNAADEAVVAFVGVPRHAYSGLTANTIA
jgi:hypothetical protein